MPTAQIRVTLPVAPPQLIPQLQRTVVVTVAGSAAAPAAMPPDSRGPVDIAAPLDVDVIVEVREVLANAKESLAAAISFKPSQFVQPVPADPAGFAVEIQSVTPDPAAPGVAPAGEGSPDPPQ